MDEAPKKRGRPPGVRNKPKDEQGRLVPPSTKPEADYRHADPDTIVSRQLSMLDWAQQAMRNEMQRAMQKKGMWVSVDDIHKLEKLSNAIVRAIDALKKSSDLATELASRLTPAQLMEAALAKIEGQDLATLNYAIKRLRAHRERLAPIHGMDKIQMAEPGTATAAIASLGD